MMPISQGVGKPGQAHTLTLYESAYKAIKNVVG